MTESAAVDNPIVDEPVAVPKDKTAEKERSKTKPKKQPPYAVTVHNDDKHTWLYVFEVLQRICAHNKQTAYQLTARIHYTGQAVVWTGALEVAELKRDQIRAFGTDFYAPEAVTFPLGVTIEPLPSD